MTRWTKFLIAFDQLGGQVIFGGAAPDETISAYVWRRKYKRWIRFVDWLFYPGHCRDAYISEKCGTQNAAEYRS